MGLTTAKLRTAWKAFECAEGDMVTIDFGPDRIKIAPPTEDAWRALAAVLGHHGYRIRTADTDSYNCRTITGGTGKSLHSYGIALDVNWKTNPFIKTPDKRKVRFSTKPTQAEREIDVKHHIADTDMTPAMIDDVMAIKTTAGASGFEWGGHFSSIKDAMHFEIDMSPEDLAKGIDWTTVKGTVANPSSNIPSANNGESKPMSTTPTAAFMTCYPFIQKWEGGFVDHPQDPGGATNMGITIDTLSSWRGRPVTVQDVRDLTPQEAQEIYFARYWTPLRCDEMPVSLALMTFNASVNSGPGRAARMLQQTLNQLQQNLAVDGVVGPKTLAAATLVDQRSAVDRYAIIYEDFYRSLSTFGTFGKGWLNRLSDVKNGALGLIGQPLPAPSPAPAPAVAHSATPAPAPIPTASTAQVPAAAPVPASNQAGHESDLAAVFSRVAELIQVLQKAQADTAQPSTTAAQDKPSSDLAKILQTVLAIASQTNGTAQADTSSSTAAQPTGTTPATETGTSTQEEHGLTPVNNALGPGIGKALDGRKTAIGTIGMLATTLLPVFFPQLAPLASLVSAVDPAITGQATTGTQAQLMSVVQPLFATLAGWGFLGKLDKWTEKLSHRRSG
ncbi:MAG: glycosyl hydrolase 108 family protein [Pseudomonadota bacterium]